MSMNERGPGPTFGPGPAGGTGQPQQSGGSPGPLPTTLRVERPGGQPEEPKGRNLLPVAAVGVAAIVFGAILWFAYDRGSNGSADGVAPTIRADSAPTKIKPEQPGGMQVPYQDTMVYDRLAPGKDKDKKPSVEKLLPPPEAPMARPDPVKPPADLPKPPAATTTTTALSPQTLSPPAVSAPVVAPPAPAISTAPKNLAAPPPAAATGTLPAFQTTPSTKSPTALAPPPAAADKPAAAEKAPVATAAAGESGYRLQLGAVTSEALAKTEFAKLQASHGDLLGGLKLQTEQVTAGGKTLFRIKAGPIDAARAKELCGRLAAQKVGCIAR